MTHAASQPPPDVGIAPITGRAAGRRFYRSEASAAELCCLEHGNDPRTIEGVDWARTAYSLFLQPWSTATSSCAGRRGRNQTSLTSPRLVSASRMIKCMYPRTVTVYVVRTCNCCALAQTADDMHVLKDSRRAFPRKAVMCSLDTGSMGGRLADAHTLCALESLHPARKGWDWTTPSSAATVHDGP